MQILPSIPLLIALCLPAQEAQAPVSKAAIDAAIDRGAQYLISEQDLDGSWRFDTPRHLGGMTGFALYTLLKAGISPEHQAVRRGLHFLDTVDARTTYEAACMILAYGSASPEKYAQRLQGLTDLLVEWHNGTWAYPEGAHDISNTHFGTLGLRHAARVGCEVPLEVWEKTADAMVRWQEDDGAFLYHAGREATLSMTVAGMGIVCIAREALAASLAQTKKKPTRLMRALDDSLALGMRWIETRHPVPVGEWKGNDPHRRWDYYYLYGLQRVGVLAPQAEIAGLEWYPSGARWLIQKQAKDGHWATAYGEGQPNTCLAILFLKRASAPITGEKTNLLQVVKVEDPEAEVQIIASGQNPTRIWIRALHPMIYDSWEWPEETGQGLRIRKVEYRSGDQVLATVPGDEQKPSRKIQFPAEIEFPELGSYPLRARIYFAPPPGEPEATPYVESPEIVVAFTEGMQPWMQEYSTSRARNLLLQTQVEASASSQFNSGWSAQQAADGLQGKGWLCSNDDEEPSLTLDLKKAMAANRILLTHASQNPKKLDEFATATQVRITINKRKPFVVDMNPNVQRKTVVELPRKERIRRLHIELLACQRGELYDRAAGLMEVELELR